MRGLKGLSRLMKGGLVAGFWALDALSFYGMTVGC